MTRTIEPAGLGALGRYSEPALLVLASLSASEKHGYAIIRDVETHTGKRLGPGTLYGAIARLEKLRFIEARPVGDRGRRPYRISAAGRRAFERRVRELQNYQLALQGLASS